MISRRLFFTIFLLNLIQSAFAQNVNRDLVRSIEFWGNYKSLTLTEKIAQNAPTEIIDYVQKLLLESGRQSHITQSVSIPADFQTDLKAAIAEIPNDIQLKINEKLTRIFIVKGLGSSGMTVSIMDASGKEVAGFIVCDIDAMNFTANKWATWKESDPFNIGYDEKIQVTMATQVNDNRQSTLQYLLLHEFAHVLSIDNRLLPSWNIDPSAITITPQMRYFNQSWQKISSEFVSRFDDFWPERSKIKYYRGSETKLPFSSALTAYNNLSYTDFTTLYSVTTSWDDFAEAFANYIHVVIMKKPWQVELSSPYYHIIYQSCWEEYRCLAKRNIIEEVIFQNIN